jgi:large subunit ribosomal protein L29
MATASDLAVLDEVELVGRLGEAQRELFNLRFQLATGQLDNTSRLGHVRRDVARLLTVLRQREIEEAEGTYVAATPAAQAAARAHLAAEDEAARAKAAPAEAAEAEPDEVDEPDEDDELDDRSDETIDDEDDEGSDEPTDDEEES